MVYVVVFESWLDDARHYTYANMSAWRTKKKAQEEVDLLNGLLPDDTFDSYFIDEVALW